MIVCYDYYISSLHEHKQPENVPIPFNMAA